MSTKQHIDQAALAELKSIMEDDFKLLVDTFLTDSDMRIASLKSALSQNDPHSFGETAHSFKGSSLNICAIELSNLCQQLETMGRSGQLDNVNPMLEELDNEYATVSDLLKEIAG